MEVKVMKYNQCSSWSFSLGIILTALFIVMIFGLGNIAYAGERGGSHEGRFMDSRYHHDHYYPNRGQYVSALPRDHHEFVYGKARYHFAGGIWYRPIGSRFMIIAPPIGLVIPFLPPFYTTVWVAGIPYYYANEVYYARRGAEYVVVDPPQGETDQVPPTSGQMYIYPRQGQNEQKQADDRYACHKWAVGETSYDPTKQNSKLSEVQLTQKRADYQRAMGACLEGRGYTVK
jgi:hypothetical protein